MLLPLTTVTTAGEVRADQSTRETLTIPMVVYILDSEDINDDLSSQRTVESFEKHFQEVNHIWNQADIAIQPVEIERVKVPHGILSSVVYRTGRGGIREFFRGARRGEVEFKTTNQTALMWAFYVRSMGDFNGLAPIGSKAFFVADNPTVKDARVTSHEIGHVLGLYHTNSDQRMLLYSGTDGIVLTEEEQQVARYNVKRLLQGQP